MAHPEKLYGLLGYPLVHSFSQNYFNQKFESENIDAEYINFEIPDVGMLMEVVAENENLNGLNVTIPYKEQVIPFLDEIDPAASEVAGDIPLRVRPASRTAVQIALIFRMHPSLPKQSICRSLRIPP